MLTVPNCHKDPDGHDRRQSCGVDNLANSCKLDCVPRGVERVGH